MVLQVWKVKISEGSRGASPWERSSWGKEEVRGSPGGNKGGA